MEKHTQLKILAIGYEVAIMEVVERLLNSHDGWNGVIAYSVEEGIGKLSTEKYNAVLLCVGVSAAAEKIVRDAVDQLQLNTQVIRHYGGGSGLLENELRAALDHNHQ